MQTSRECVKRAIEGGHPDRIPVCLSFDSDSYNYAVTKDIIRDYESDIIIVPCLDPEFVPAKEGYTQWGYKMETFGETMGEVLDPPLKDWENYEKWEANLPDFTAKSRFAQAKRLRELYPDKFLAGGLGMMMEEIINLRGYANCMIDYYEEEENLNRLIDCLYEKGKQMVDGYAESGMDAVIAWEDWGLQSGPMISLSLWKEYYYERMKDFVAYIHSKGMKYLLHSCGHITYLLDTFVEIGVDVIQMDQQMNMGFELLSQWKEKICFWCPVDIQHSVLMQEEEMKAYIDEMVKSLGSPNGGFMYKAYAQPAALHMPEGKLRKEIEFMQHAVYN